MSKFVVGRNPSKIQWHGGAMKAIGGHGFHVLFYSFMVGKLEVVLTIEGCGNSEIPFGSIPLRERKS